MTATDPRAGAASRSGNGFERVLVPTDFSPASEAALALAGTIARRFGATLHLLHVVEPGSETGPYALNLYAPAPDPVPRATLEDARQRLDRLRPPDLTSVPAVVVGHPAKAILDHAARVHIDLIVMGTQGRTGLSYMFLGSVAEHVVRTAPCPVLTVRPRAG
jgi:universal stress protein A